MRNLFFFQVCGYGWADVALLDEAAAGAKKGLFKSFTDARGTFLTSKDCSDASVIEAVEAAARWQVRSKSADYIFLTYSCCSESAETMAYEATGGAWVVYKGIGRSVDAFEEGKMLRDDREDWVEDADCNELEVPG